MELMHLSRTGKPALSFLGRQVAWVDTNEHNQTRWFTIELYETLPDPAADHGRPGIVAGVSFYTNWEGEKSHLEVAVFGGGMPDAANWLANFDPIPEGVGFPPGKQFDTRQRLLLTRLRAEYAGALSEAFAQAGYTESL